MKTIVFLQAILLIGKGSVFASTEVTSYQPYQNSPNNDEYEHDGNIHNSIRNLFDSIVSSVQNAGERILSMRHRRTQAGFSVDEEVTCAPSKDMSVTFSFLFPTAAPGSSENDETNSDAPSMAPVVALRPTLIPTPGVCDVMVDVSCVLEGNSGTSCKTFDSPSMSCYNEDMAELKFTYRHDQTCSSTLGNSNQGDQYTCTDNNSPSCNSITAEDKVFVKCYNGNDVYCESRARDGGFVTISSKFVDNQEVLPNQITCAISTEADPKNPCQLFTFNPSGEGTSLNLKNQFGSLTLESCTNDQGQTNNCIESVIYKYNINNPGDTTVTITELSGNGQSLIEDKNSSELIIPMKSNGSLDQVGTIDYCTDSCYEISSSITATSSEGAICKDDGKLDFCVVVPTTTAPTSIPTVLDITSQPSQGPTPAPITTEPTLAPTCVPTGGFCTGTDASDKCCEDGAECVQDLTTGSGGQTVYKCTMLTPSPTKQPTSAPTTPEPTEEPTLAPITLLPIPAPITPEPTKSPTATPSIFDVASLPTVSTTNAPITIEPTAPPTQKPTRVCRVDVDVDCRINLNDGSITVPCEDYQLPSFSCYERDMTNLVFLYSHSTCADAQGKNSQGDEYACADSNFQDTVCSFSSSDEVYVECRSGDHEFFSRPIKDGDYVAITIHSVVLNTLPDQITCTVSTSEGGTECQEFTFNPSGGDTPLNLKNKFGSLTLESCIDTEFNENECHKQVVYTYNVDNNGDTNVNIVELTDNGNDLTNGRNESDLAVPESESLAFQETGAMDYCTGSCVRKIANIIAMSSDGATCEDEEEIIFCVDPSPTPSPTRYPTPNPTRSPTSHPTNAPFVADPITSEPTASPTGAPVTPNPVTLEPTREATLVPTPSPTRNPTSEPTPSPTRYPTANPTLSPTPNPTSSPTNAPIVVDDEIAPTKSPTGAPVTPNPVTLEPTREATLVPTPSPTRNPTSEPTPSPTRYPTANPTLSPTSNPTSSPTNAPFVADPITSQPTSSPTGAPVTPEPTLALTLVPTPSPTRNPTSAPITPDPTVTPTVSPTDIPASRDDLFPIAPNPTRAPTVPITAEPTYARVTAEPTRAPITPNPTAYPTESPINLVELDGTAHPTCYPPQTDIQPSVVPEGSQNDSSDYNTSESKGDYIYGKKSSGKGRGKKSGKKGLNGKKSGKGSASTDSSNTDFSSGKSEAGGKGGKGGKRADFASGKGKGGGKGGKGGKGKDIGKGSISTVSKESYDGSGDSSHSKGSNTASGNTSASDSQSKYFESKGSSGKKSSRGGKKSGKYTGGKASTAAKGGYTESQDSSHSKGYDTTSGKSAEKASTSDASKGSYSDAGSTNSDNIPGSSHSKGSYGKSSKGKKNVKASTAAKGGYTESQDSSHSKGYDTTSGKSAGKASTSDMSKGSFSDAGSPDMPGPKNNAPMDTNGGSGSADSPELPNYGNDYYSKGSDSNSGKAGYGKKWTGGSEDVLSSIDTGDTSKQGHFHYSSGKSSGKAPLDADIAGSVSGKSAGKASTSDVSKGSYSDTGSTGSSHSKGSYGKSSKGKKNVKASTAAKGGYTESQDSSHSKGYDTTSGKSAGKASTSDTSKGSYSDAGSIYSDNISVSPASKGSYGQTSSGKKSAKASTEKKSGKTGKELRG